MTRLVLGVIGHVDHGKTALVRALTGENTDRLAEEQRRGISIALGFAHLRAGSNADIDLIDMPGHERFVRTMISGATGIDAVLLVVAADDGIKPQTREHVDIAGLLGLERAVVAITKTDLVAPDEALRVADEALKLLALSGLAPLPPVLTSVTGECGIDELRATLEALAAGQQPRRADGTMYLPIDRAFSMAGHGPVVTGTLRGGPVAAGDTLDLLPSMRRVRVRSVQVHGAPVTHGLPGQRVALNLRDVDTDDLRQGMVLSQPDTLTPAPWLSVSLRAVATAPPLKNGMRLRALLGTQEFDVRVRLLDRDVLESGGTGLAQLHCAQPVAAPPGEHVILRIASPARTVGGGRVLELETRRLRRRDPRILQRLDDLSKLPPAALLAAEVQRAMGSGTTLRHLARTVALSIPRVVELLQTLPVEVTRSGNVVRLTDMQHLVSTVPGLLEASSLGLTLAEVLEAIPGTGVAVLDLALERLLAGNVIAKRGNRFVIPRPDRDRELLRNESDLAVRIADELRRGGLAPPDPSVIVIDQASKRAVDRLLREGVVVRAVDHAKHKEILFHREAIDHARRVLAPLLEHPPGLLVTDVGTALGISRKYSMPLLDHLDSIRFTRRINDRRIRGKAPL